MTLDCLVALSLLPAGACPDLLARLAAGDPTLDDLSRERLARARDALVRAADAGVSCVSVEDQAYPSRLLTIADPPPVLWYRGSLSHLSRPAVALVGSRAATPGGLDVAFSLGADLARAGAVVVSGMALGIDGAAHRGALSTGSTVGVMGCGLDVAYPRSHRRLADDIATGGALVGEYPPGVPPLAHHFPRRNRIVSGLADAVIVVEAAERSGSLITARLALEQGREVMAVPGSIAGGRNRGGHALIRDGAALVEGADDVFRELGWVVSVPAASSAGQEGGLLALMPPGQDCSLDWLAARFGRPGSEVLAGLLELELAGLVTRTGSGGFMRASGTCYRN